jgi:hypothetical protein
MAPCFFQVDENADHAALLVDDEADAGRFAGP